MPTKTITTTVTLHVPSADHVPFTFDANGGIIKGKYAIDVILPGTETTLEAKEADRILKRFGGVEIAFTPDPPTTDAPPADGVPGKASKAS